MRVYKEMDLDDLVDEMCCSDTIDCLREMFGDAADSALEVELEDTSVEDAEETVKDNIYRILTRITNAIGRPLTMAEVDNLKDEFWGEVTDDSLKDHGIPLEGRLRDEHGEYELVPADDPRQMTLFDESGLPPPMKKRYITTEE